MGLLNVYDSMKDYKSAFFYCRKFIELKDSIYSKENLRIIEETDKKYKLEKKDTEIQLAFEREKLLNKQKPIYWLP